MFWVNLDYTKKLRIELKFHFDDFLTWDIPPQVSLQSMTSPMPRKIIIFLLLKSDLFFYLLCKEN